jgi:hypothetical protein
MAMGIIPKPTTSTEMVSNRRSKCPRDNAVEDRKKVRKQSRNLKVECDDDVVILSD